MPWCPKCKSEYREGFTVCADCGSELIDEEQFRKLEEERAAQEEAERLKLAMQRVAAAGEDTDSGTAAGTQPEQDEEGDGSAREAESAAAQPKRTPVAPTALVQDRTAVYQDRTALYQDRTALYQDSTERANENRSSAWILMIMGGVGLIVVVLGILGVIPLHFSNPYLFYGVMAAVFLLFLVAGVVSLKNARIFDKKAESENSLRDAMLTWCRENLHAQEVDREIGVVGAESEEALYFKRFECIKAKLNYQFVNLDQGFLEKFIDDSVYDMIYDRAEE